MSWDKFADKIEELKDAAVECEYRLVVLALKPEDNTVHLWENIHGKMFKGQPIASEFLGQIYSEYANEIDEWSPPEIKD